VLPSVSGHMKYQCCHLSVARRGTSLKGTNTFVVVMATLCGKEWISRLPWRQSVCRGFDDDAADGDLSWFYPRRRIEEAWNPTVSRNWPCLIVARNVNK
jgi:hypothetical protein